MLRKRIGLIVNPLAGLGGRVGLKGSDGADIQRRALQLGAVAESARRALRAVEMLLPLQENLNLLTYPAEMGADVVAAAGLEATVLGSITPGRTTAQDTMKAARQMLHEGADLLLFAGGDGTARDIYDAVGQAVPALGIPAGVKIHSAVFATSPEAAGELAALCLQGRCSGWREAEVLDIDEEAFRRGVLSARLYGYLRIPFRRELVQGAKAQSGPGEQAAQQAIATQVVEEMENDCLYILGPGTTVRAVAERLGLEKTLLGVDVTLAGQLVALDVGEAQLLELLRGNRAKIVVTPIGGQGCIFGRGNQQISPRVITEVGKGNIIVVSTVEKLNSRGGQPLWVDTGDREVDEMLSGYARVVTGYHEQIVCAVT
ncbi:MAG TPA: ATP-NAD kinase family protein, partial [Anaerolineae bacterium]|nr:ATP-NAD kinase family protein [Anaerolineae bacterium]